MTMLSGQLARPSAQAFGLSQYVYWVFLALSALLVVSPVARELRIGIPYDRLCEGVIVLLILGRLWVVRDLPLPKRGALFASASISYYLMMGVINGIWGSDFNPTIFVIDGKILLCLASLYAYQNVTISTDVKQRLARVAFWSFAVSVVLFGLFTNVKDRLTLLDESNYMMMNLVIVVICYISTFKAKALSSKWVLAYSILVLASILAQSRTGFAIVLLLAAAMLWNSKKLWALSVILYVGIIVVIIDGPALYESVLRGQTDIGKIDRFIFLQEFFYQLTNRSWLDMLFGGHVGTYVSYNPLYMNWWVSKMSADQGIPYGLAPFNFHILYLRVISSFGLVFGLFVIGSMLHLFWRNTNRYIVLAVAISGISMSVFYLSSVMPYLVLALLLARRDDAVEVATEGRPVTIGRSHPA